jgi:hypothetical protein
MCPERTDMIETLAGGFGGDLFILTQKGRQFELRRRCASKTCGGVAPGGGLRTDQVKRMKELEADNARLRRTVSNLTLGKMILAEAAKGNF